MESGDPKTRLGEKLQQLSDGKLAGTALLAAIGETIDLATDLRDTEAVGNAIRAGRSLLDGALSREDQTLLRYFLGNAWSFLRMAEEASEDLAWAWKRENLEQELVCFRQARREPGFADLSTYRRAQILTNTANLLDTIGRFVEACELFDEASVVHPAFPMALGNKGRALWYYAVSHYDKGQAAVLLSEAHSLLSEAIARPLEGNAKVGFQRIIAAIEKVLSHPDRPREALKRSYSLGDSSDEREYRKWCLSKKLFLSPLNDCGPFTIAAHDPLVLPSIVTRTSEGPWFVGLFNQLKQEYVSARFLLFEGIVAKGSHHSDRQTKLIDTFDSSTFGLKTEKVKLAFRMAYSLLDKVAFFVNEYFGLGLAESRISFRRVWYLGGDSRRGINPKLEPRRNWPLRGLYWLSRDLFEDEAPFVEVLEPAAKDLRDLRNALEHRYVKVRAPEVKVPDFAQDRLARVVSRAELIDKTVRLMSFARAALIYLSFSVHSEERLRRRDKKGCGEIRGKTLPIKLREVGEEGFF